MTLPIEVAKRRIESLATFLMLGTEESEDDIEVRVQALCWVLARELQQVSKDRQERLNSFFVVLRLLASSLGLNWKLVAPDEEDDDPEVVH